MIIRGGGNIYPRQIEDVLYTLSARLCMGASIVGVPDRDWVSARRICPDQAGA